MRQSQMHPGQTAHSPKTPAGAVDVDRETRELFVALVDAMPGGRKSMGFHAHRVNKAAVGSYTPRPSDFVLAVERGACAERAALYFRALADHLLATLPTGTDGSYPAVVREVAEAVAAGAEWIAAPTPANGHTARREIAEAVTHLRLLDSTVAASTWRASRRTPIGRVEVMR